MALIKSVSGIRGTIGGKPGENLTPFDLVKFTSAFVQLLKQKENKDRIHIVLGRDARISGPMVAQLVIGTLTACGADVTDIGQATTPTTEVAVCELHADGGVILTASHNPEQWNALKLLNKKGQFISAEEGKYLLSLSEDTENNANFVSVHKLGTIAERKDMLNKHIERILNDPLVNASVIAAKNYKIVVDGINSVGGFAIPALLKRLGISDIIVLNGEPNGRFTHNPEPLPENLTQITEAVKTEKADLGIVVDPDADRLAFVSEDGSMFGEEYTLVAVADYVLQYKKSPVVSNLSSGRALRDIAQKYGVAYYSSAVGELNVTDKMAEVNAEIGGEGNGGVIYPAIRFGRDALTGTALFLSHLAKSGKTVSALRQEYPNYAMIKSKISLPEGAPLQKILEQTKMHFETDKNAQLTTIDGVKVDFPDSWVHLRPSNTEPVIRIYAEAPDMQKAEKLAESVKYLVSGLL